METIERLRQKSFLLLTLANVECCLLMGNFSLAETVIHKFEKATYELRLFEEVKDHLHERDKEKSAEAISIILKAIMLESIDLDEESD